MKITMIGAGQVGLAWASAIEQVPDVNLFLCDPVPSERAQHWAREHGVPLSTEIDATDADTDIAFLGIPGLVVEQVIPALRTRLQHGAVIADLSTASAGTKRAAACAAEESGISYIDIAITGAVGIHGVRTPILYAGPRNPRLIEVLDQVQAPTTVMEGSTPGDAIAVKLYRSIIMKGLEALAVETLPAAQAQGVLEPLLNSLGDVDRAPFRDLVRSMIVSHPGQSYRRYAEVLEAQQQLSDSSRSSDITDKVAEKFATTKQAAETKGTPADDDFTATLEWLSELDVPAQLEEDTLP